MIAVETNVLVHAHRTDSSLHERAAPAVRRLAESRAAWAIPWPCLHEFLAVVTHPRIFDPPTPLAAACDQVSAWLDSPSVTLLGETGGHWAVLVDLLNAQSVTGPRVHDARVAAICLQHAVAQLWTLDRDFSRFPALRVSNPLVEPVSEDDGQGA